MLLINEVREATVCHLHDIVIPVGKFCGYCKHEEIVRRIVKEEISKLLIELESGNARKTD